VAAKDVRERGEGVDHRQNLRRQQQRQGQEETHLAFFTCRPSGSQISLSFSFVYQYRFPCNG